MFLNHHFLDEFRTSCRCSLCGSKGVEGKCSTFRECITTYGFIFNASGFTF